MGVVILLKADLSSVPAWAAGRRTRGHKKPPWSVAVAATLMVTAALSGCGAGTSGSSRQTEHLGASVITKAPTFTVSVSAGELHLVPGRSGRVSLKGTATYRGGRPPSLSWEDNGKQLSLRSVCHSRNGDCGYDYTLYVPVSTKVVAGVTAGDISASGLSGPLQLNATAGNVTLTGLSGHLEVNSLAGNVTAADLSPAWADVEEGTGNVALRFTAPPSYVHVKAFTGNIDVVVPRPSGYHVSTSDHLGNVSVGIVDNRASTRVMTLSVETGNISVQYEESG
jgi:hypothetical protein